MSDLSSPECRVLGVLVEKALTTPGQYPITLNGLTNGCNQKSNREPVLNLSEDEVLDTLDALRAKGLAQEVMLSGSRVAKYKHNARETLAVSTSELVVLVELLLRGPQTVGEIRGRASRMHPLESTEVVGGILDSLMNRESPFVKRLTGGGRAPRYAQTLGPLPRESPKSPESPIPLNNPDSPLPTSDTPDSALVQRITVLEHEVTMLRNDLKHLAKELGVSLDPPSSTPPAKPEAEFSSPG